MSLPRDRVAARPAAWPPSLVPSLGRYEQAAELVRRIRARRPTAAGTGGK